MESTFHSPLSYSETDNEFVFLVLDEREDVLSRLKYYPRRPSRCSRNPSENICPRGIQSDEAVAYYRQSYHGRWTHLRNLHNKGILPGTITSWGTKVH
jgi:hypothetical protein